MRPCFGITLALIAVVSEILANPVHHDRSFNPCAATGPCSGHHSQCCSATTILLCNDSGLMQTSNCDAGGICVNLSDTLAECQAADVCDEVGSECSTEVFVQRCCADGKRFAVCSGNQIFVGGCTNCHNKGKFVVCGG